MAKSPIEWTDFVWNPTTGCDKVSQGCKYCYAEIMHKRLQGMGQPKYQLPFLGNVVCHEAELERDFGKKPKMIFGNSMSDLFHEAVPLEFIQRVFKVMNDNPQHVFQVLTKRPERMASLSLQLNWTPNIWAGTSVEDYRVKHRVLELRKTGAKVKFLSCEPLIGSLGFEARDLDGIDWVIVGGESGSKARLLDPDWVHELFWVCKSKIHPIPFFFKQWGGRNKKAAGRLYHGREWNEMPAIIQLENKSA